MTAYARAAAPAHRSRSGAPTLAADQQAAIDAGFMLIPSYSRTDPKWRKVPIEGWQQRSYTPDDFQMEHGAMLRLGRYPNGWYLYFVDLDSHNPRQQAWKSRNLLRWNLQNNALADRLPEYKSTRGAGLHLPFWSPVELKGGTLHDNQGHKIGELLSLHVVFPDDYRRQHLSLTETPELTVEEVNALLTALNFREGSGATVDTSEIDLDDRLVQHWYKHYEALEDERGVARAIGDGPSYKVLKGLAPITNASDARFMVMDRMFTVGYSDAQIVGYALRRCAWNRDGQALVDDCTRILARLINERPDRRISPYATQRDQAVLQPQGTPSARNELMSPPKRQRGRPMGGIPERLLAYLTVDGEHGTFTDTNAVFMAELHCSERSIQRALDALETRGAIRRQIVNGQRLITLTPDQRGDNKSAAQPAQQITETTHQEAANPLLDRGDDTGTEEVTSCSPLPPVVTPETVTALPTLADAVYEAYCTYRTERTARRVRLVVYHVTTNYPGLAAEEQIRACYRGGMEVKRRWLVECDLRQVAPHELKAIKKAGAAIAWQGAKGNTSGIPNKQQKLGQFIQDRVERECARRGITLRRHRTAGASVVDLWEAAAEAEAELSSESAVPQAGAIPSYDELLSLLSTVIEVKPKHIALPDYVYKFHQDTPSGERVRIAQALAMFTTGGAV